jgi:CBS-domain-containing membrane protein
MREKRYRIDAEHPLGGEMSDIVRGLFRRLQLSTLLRHHSSVPLLALFSFVNGCTSIGLMALVALATREPFIFPSLGPTAFLFFYTPTAPAAAPRNTLFGHAIGAAAGWLSLALFGLTDAGPALVVGVDWRRVLAAGLSLGLTSGVMVLLRAPHPPAGATTLIVSLGLLPELRQLGVLLVAVALLTLQAYVINRLAGIPYPLWSPATEPPPRSKPGDGQR